MSDLDGITVEGTKPSAADDARQFEQQNMRALTDDLSSFDPVAQTNAIAGQMPQPTADMQQAPQDHMGDLMKVAPIFMGMAALGGKVFRSHGIAMLASTNAMMKGFASGNEQQFKNATIDYQNKWKQLKDQQQNWFDTYKAVYEARKGQWDARIKAQEAANRVVGEDDKSHIASEKTFLELQRLNQQADASAARIEQMSRQTDIKLGQLGLNQDKQKFAEDQKLWERDHPKTSAAGSAKSAKADQDIDSAISEIQSARDSAGTGTVGGPGKLKKIGESIKGAFGSNAPQPAHLEETKIKLAQTAVNSLLKAGHITKQDAARMDTILRGLSIGDNPQNAKDSFDEVIKFLQSKKSAASGSGKVMKFDSKGNLIP